MKLLLALCFAFAFSAPSFALTPKEVKNSYEGCMKFLKLPVAKQRAIVNNTQYSMSQALWACHLQARHSLAYMERSEREYQRAIHSGGGYSSGSDSGSSSSSSDDSRDDPYGGSGGGFGGAGVCSSGVCTGPHGTTVCSSGVCTGPGGTTVCTSGVCNGPGGTTVCSGGVCTGPNGTTVCSGGVCN